MKTVLRQHFRDLRRRHAPVLQQALDRELAIWLDPCTRLNDGEFLGLFWPLGAEADLRHSLQVLLTPLALPVVEAGALLYRPWQPDAPLAPDGCGIPAPLPALPPLRPDQLALLLVPALALDRQGIRLGSGGGWYDRLRSDPAWRRVPALAVLPSVCVVERLPAEPWDVPFDGWLDEHGCHWLVERRF